MPFTTVRFRNVASGLILLAALCGTVGTASAQICLTNSTATPVHAEGLAERIADITVTCTGGTAGATVSLTLFVSLNGVITNRLDDNGDPVGISLTGATGTLRVTSPSNLSLNAVNYVVPGVPATPVLITLSGLRVNASGLAPGTPITAAVAGVGATINSGAQVAVGSPSASLLSSLISNGVPCVGSALPDPLDFPTFIATSSSSTIRVTESSPSAFSVKKPGDDTGARVLVRITGYGPGVRIFVPDALVGINGTQPTSAGAFSSTIGGGVYTPGGSQLLLSRVAGNDSNGGGGAPSFALPAAITAFSTLTELTVTNGAASVVYEVLDASASVQETFQVPVFVVAPPRACPSTLTTNVSAVLAPVSTVPTATKTDPIPRFLAVTPPSDCQLLSDCNAPYFPKLSVDQTPLVLTGSSQGDPKSGFVRVGNSGAGIVSFTTSIGYTNGNNWLSVTPSTGSNSATLQVTADPSKLTEGTYTATVTVNGGPYGSATVPVTFNVGPVGVVVLSVGNAASFQYGTVAPGSYAVLYGLNMAGRNVAVTFNGLPATVVYASATQLNLIVPSGLGIQQAASVLVTVDGLVSNAFRVNLLPNALGIFNPGIVNFANSQVNTVTNPATRGDIVLVFLTGLASPVTGQVTVNIGGQTNLIPGYAGPQGTLPALGQVNIAVPATLPASPNPVPLQVCIPDTLGRQACSNQVNLYIK